MHHAAAAALAARRHRLKQRVISFQEEGTCPRVSPLRGEGGRGEILTEEREGGEGGEGDEETGRKGGRHDRERAEGVRQHDGVRLQRPRPLLCHPPTRMKRKTG